MNCALSTLKFFVYIFNVIFGILGIVLLGIAAYLATKAYGDQQPFNITGIVLGVIIVSISILGCCAMQRESVWLMWMYAAIVGLIFILQIAAIIIFYRQDFDKAVSDRVETAWQQHKFNPSGMNYYQSQYKCCGERGPMDYDKHNETIPDSCYEFKHEKDAKYLFTTGCLEMLIDITRWAVKMSATISWIVLIIEGTAFFAAAMLANYYRRHRMSIHMY